MDRLPPARQRVGIVSGSGPEAGIDLWAKVQQSSRALLGERYRGDLDAPEVIVHSVPGLGLSMELERNDALVWPLLAETMRNLDPQVDAYAIACNTLNHYEARLRALPLRSRLISTQDVVRGLVRERGLTKVALLGARPVMEMGPWSAYRDLPQVVQVELPRDADALHEIIYDVKTRGGDAPDIVRRFEAVLEALEAPVVLLACTELPLIPARSARHELVDVTALLAGALARIGQLPRGEALPK
jgi:aspartate racemase